MGDISGDVELTNPRIDPDRHFHYVDISSVDRSTKRISASKLVLGANAPSRARQVIRADDVLVSTTRPNLNAVAQVPPNLDGQICSTGFCVLRPTQDLVPEFLFRFVQTKRFVDALSRGATGSSYPAVTDNLVKDMLIPLPPLAEQKRIVGAVEERLESIDDAKQAVETQTEAVESLAAAYLRAVFPKPSDELPEGWERVRLGEACEIMIGKTPPRKESRAWGGGHPWAKISDIQGDVVSSTSESLSDFGAAICQKRLLRKGTTMFSFKLTIGKTALAGVDMFANEAIAGLVPRNSQSLRSDYLMYALRAVDHKSGADNAVKGKTLNKSSMSRLVIPVPGMDTQLRIASDLKRSQQNVADARRAAETQRCDLTTLRGAYLGLAFEGSL